MTIQQQVSGHHTRSIVGTQTKERISLSPYKWKLNEKYNIPKIILTLACLLLNTTLLASTEEHKPCNPKIYFIDGFGGKGISSIPDVLNKEFNEAGILTEIHSHWQLDDRGKEGKTCEGVFFGGLSLCTFLSTFLPPSILFCGPTVFMGTIGCGELFEEGELGKSLLAGLERKEDPIILVGYSWGGDTAYETGNWLVKNTVNYQPRISVVTLDAVGKHKSRKKRGIGRWINIHVNESTPDKYFNGCGLAKPLLNAGKLAGTRAYLHESYADININANAPKFGWSPPLNHCSILEMYTLAQDFIEEEIQKTCGNEFEFPKRKWNPFTRRWDIYFNGNQRPWGKFRPSVPPGLERLCPTCPPL